MSRLQDKSLNPEPQETSHNLGEEAPPDFTELQTLTRTMEKLSLTEEPRPSASASSPPQCAQESQTPEPLATEEPVLTEPDQEELNDSGEYAVDLHQKLISLKVQILCALMDKDYTLVRQLCQMILVYDPSDQRAADILNTMRQGQPNGNNESGDDEADSGGDEDESDDEGEGEESSEDEDDDDDESDEDGGGDRNSHRENPDDDEEDVEDEYEEDCD